ncbi:hypothetical protein PIB30_056406, partial [Stylosanthes scabra]|nr:hypothetical protein [Stylosanthes scabra]
MDVCAANYDRKILAGFVVSMSTNDERRHRGSTRNATQILTQFDGDELTVAVPNRVKETSSSTSESNEEHKERSFLLSIEEDPTTPRGEFEDDDE